MDKIELAKLLGLEESRVPYFGDFKENMEVYDLETDVGFRVGDKYFDVQGKSMEECWWKAADKFLTDLGRIATVGYSNKAMWG